MAVDSLVFAILLNQTNTITVRVTVEIEEFIMFILLLLILLTVALLLFMLYHVRYRKLKDIPVHFPTLPIIGGFLYLKSDPVEQRKQYWDISFNRNPDQGIIAFQMGLWPMALIYKAEYLQDLLNSHEIRKIFDYMHAKPWLGEGLITRLNIVVFM